MNILFPPEFSFLRVLRSLVCSSSERPDTHLDYTSRVACEETNLSSRRLHVPRCPLFRLRCRGARAAPYGSSLRGFPPDHSRNLERAAATPFTRDAAFRGCTFHYLLGRAPVPSVMGDGTHALAFTVGSVTKSTVHLIFTLFLKTIVNTPLPPRQFSFR